MLYLFHGPDTYRSLKKIGELISHLKKNRNADLSLFNVTDENFEASYFKNLINSIHLFGEKNLVVLKRVLENGEAADFVLKNLEKCANSDNIFIFFEENISKEAFLEFKKYAQKILEFNFLDKSRLSDWFNKELKEKNITLSYKEKENLLARYGSDLWALSNAIEKNKLGFVEDNGGGFHPVKSAEGGASLKAKQFNGVNIFDIVDSFSARDRKKTWLTLQKYLSRGVEAEEIFWKIHWQIQNLILIKSALEEYRIQKKINANSSAAEFVLKEKLKLHPFVLKKCLYAEKRFSKNELEKFNEELANIYQNSRYKNLELDIALEKFLLSI